MQTLYIQPNQHNYYYYRPPFLQIWTQPRRPSFCSCRRPHVASFKGNAGCCNIIPVLILSMELCATKVSTTTFVTQRIITSTSSPATACSFPNSAHKSNLLAPIPVFTLHYQSSAYLYPTKLGFSAEPSCSKHGQPIGFLIPRGSNVVCMSTRGNRTEEHERSHTSSVKRGGEEADHLSMPGRIIHSSQVLAEACRFVYNDAKFVNERARNDITMLSRGIMRLDERARKDVAILGSEFLKLDARAREDTWKIDRNVKRKAESLHHITTILKDIAESKLRSAADKHWSDGALEADLRLADFRAKQRAMEDALMALEFVKNIHDLMVSKTYKFPLRKEKGSLSNNDLLGNVTLEKNGRTLDFFPGELSANRITAIQDAYWSMAYALSEADGIDYTDPEELELLITTLIDLDAMDGKSSVSLLAECSSSPDVSTRQALANALAAAPSMWTLGNAGMGALQRLAEDRNPAIAAAAFKTIKELKKQWEVEEGDSLRFMMNQKPVEEVDNKDNADTE